MATTIFWNRLDDKDKQMVVQLVKGNESQRLLSFLRSRKVLHVTGCGCQVTPSKILQNAKFAYTQGRLDPGSGVSHPPVLRKDN